LRIFVELLELFHLQRRGGVDWPLKNQEAIPVSGREDFCAEIASPQ
jgi:hypothetical protein